MLLHASKAHKTLKNDVKYNVNLQRRNSYKYIAKYPKVNIILFRHIYKLLSVYQNCVSFYGIRFVLDCNIAIIVLFVFQIGTIQI